MKTQNPLIGRSSQKFSNSIFSTWKGINVVRSKPLEVANPQTPAQTEQRNKFGAMVNFARQALNTIKLGLKSQAIKQSEYNVFISKNIQLQDPDGSGIIDTGFPPIIFSKGTLSPVSVASAENLVGAQTIVRWSNENRPFSTPLDKVCIGILYTTPAGRITNYREVGRDTLATEEEYTFDDISIPGTANSYTIVFAYNDTEVSDNVIGNFI